MRKTSALRASTCGPNGEAVIVMLVDRLENVLGVLRHAAEERERGRSEGEQE
ncbi:MAG: hypothetical protein R2724_23985 [Bryobacterales bacterium]